MLKKVFLPILLAIAILAPNLTFALKFSDIPDDNIYSLPIQFLRDHGIIAGYPDNTYRPQEYLTRGIAAKLILSRYQANPTYALSVPDLDPTSTYPDMSPTDPFAKYLVKAGQLGIWGPNADGYYLPNQPVTRAEFMKLLISPSAINLDALENVKLYGDVPSGAWFTEYMNFAGRYGLIIPDKDNDLYPSQLINRGEAAEIGYSLLLILNQQNGAMLLQQLQAHFDKALFFNDAAKLLVAKRNAAFAVGIGQLLYDSDPTNNQFLAYAKLAKALSYTINYQLTKSIVGAESSALNWLDMAKSKLDEADQLDSSISDRSDRLKTYW